MGIIDFPTIECYWKTDNNNNNNNNNFYSENTHKYTGLTSSIKILIFVNYILIKLNVY
jgi:hypothetical protein